MVLSRQWWCSKLAVLPQQHTSTHFRKSIGCCYWSFNYLNLIYFVAWNTMVLHEDGCRLQTSCEWWLGEIYYARSLFRPWAKNKFFSENNAQEKQWTKESMGRWHPRDLFHFEVYWKDIKCEDLWGKPVRRLFWLSEALYDMGIEVLRGGEG